MHAHQPNFQVKCGISGCRRVFKKVHTLRNHISDRHSSPRNIQIRNPGRPDAHDCANAVNEPANTSLTQTHQTRLADSISLESALQKSSALFLMGLKEEKKLTQVAMQGVVDGVTTLCQSRLCSLSEEISKLFKDKLGTEVPPELEGLLDVNEIFGNPFHGLETRYKQDQYYRTHFKIVEPVSVEFGEKRVWKGTGRKRRCIAKKEGMVYVPLLNQLQFLLNDSEIYSQVKNGHNSNDKDILKDFCDGSYFREHQLFGIHPANTLQIFLYFDEVEICNPLGSKAKIHKLSMFYFTLGNLLPKQRSKLAAINLLGIVESKILSKYGMNAVLRVFLDDVKHLERGWTVTVNNKIEKYYGTIALVTGDNLGSLAIGGFKESCSALHCCRQCMATQETARSEFSEDKFLLRDKDEHEKQCSEVESDTTGQKSKDYGINRRSALCELKHFDVCICLLPDVMHDLLEGVLQYEVKLMLQLMIRTKKNFTLGTLNSRIEVIELGHMEFKDRPSPINMTTLSSSGHNLKQSASQMWLLARILPLLIGDYVDQDDEIWFNFLLLLEIVDILFAPHKTNDQTFYIYSL